MISNLKDMFHRRAAENKDAVPPLPARSFSRKHVSPLHIKKNIPPSSYAAPKQPSPSPRSLTTPNLNIPKPRGKCLISTHKTASSCCSRYADFGTLASPSFRRDASTFMTEESTSSTRKQVEHSETGLSSKAAETVPESASKSTQAKQKKEDPIFRLTSQAYSLIDRVKVEPDHTKKEAMLTTAQLAMDCVANARETEKAMHKAQQAAKEAEISYQLVKAGVGEVGRTISGMNFEKSL